MIYVSTCDVSGNTDLSHVPLCNSFQILSVVSSIAITISQFPMLCVFVGLNKLFGVESTKFVIPVGWVNQYQLQLGLRV
jgi:hypothetical protein